MKAIIGIFSVLVLTLVISCKNNSENHSTEDTTNPMNEELTKTTNYEKDGNFKEDAYTFSSSEDSINENWNLDDPERQKSLYTTFGMSKKQIQRYEDALETWRKSDSKDPYKTMSANERIKKEASILKEILDENQYEKYRKWANENDKR